MRRLLPALLLPLSLLALAACKSPCRELSERVCECRDTRVEREACRQNAAANEGRLEPSPDALDLCEARLDECPDPAADDSRNRTQLCEELESSTERKRACGLTTDEAPAP
jgi:hypothetical protein